VVRIKLRGHSEAESFEGGSVSLDLAASTFLGTLSADADGGPALVGVFAETYQRFSELRAKYNSHQIDKTELGRALANLHCYDVDGGEWMIGATSGRWYRRSNPDEPWMATPPDAALTSEAARLAARKPALGSPASPELSSGPAIEVAAVEMPAAASPAPEAPAAQSTSLPDEPWQPAVAPAPAPAPAAPMAEAARPAPVTPAPGGYGSVEATPEAAEPAAVDVAPWLQAPAPAPKPAGGGYGSFE